MQDIEAHLKGGIPNADIEALENYWQVFPTLREQLFEVGARPGYSQMKVAASEIKPAIFAHPEFAAYTQTVKAVFAKWQKANTATLKGIDIGDHPKTLIEELSEAILRSFAKVQLIDPYDIYQHLMSYWTDTMQDDVYMLVSDGWKAISDGKLNADLIPTRLIVNRYFAIERDAMEKLEAERDAISRRLEELDEEHGGEDGLLAEAKTEKGKLTKVSVNVRLKEVKHDQAADDERKALETYAALIEQESVAGKRVKDAQKALDAKVTAQYAKLSADEIKTLVVEDKWLATLAADVQTELDRISQALTGRIKTLAERYAVPLPELEKRVDGLDARVKGHLEKMGFKL